jgi:hypothetical protein
MDLRQDFRESKPRLRGFVLKHFGLAERDPRYPMTERAPHENPLAVPAVSS